MRDYLDTYNNIGVQRKCNQIIFQGKMVVLRLYVFWQVLIDFLFVVYSLFFF